MWEFIDNDEAVAIVGQFYARGLPALDACRFLIAKAALCWRNFEGDYRDDITAIVVFLPCFGEADTTSRSLGTPRLPSRLPSRERDSAMASSGRSSSGRSSGLVPSMAMERGGVTKGAKGAELTTNSHVPPPADDEAPAAGGCCGLFSQKSNRKVAPAPAPA